MSPSIVVALAVLLGLVYVARPLFAAAQPQLDPSKNDALLRKLRALEAILDLEAELAAGKLSPDDYEAFKEIHERDAVSAMRELDVAAKVASNDDIEAEIAAVRAELR